MPSLSNAVIDLVQITAFFALLLHIIANDKKMQHDGELTRIETFYVRYFCNCCQNHYNIMFDGKPVRNIDLDEDLLDWYEAERRKDCPGDNHARHGDWHRTRDHVLVLPIHPSETNDINGLNKRKRYMWSRSTTGGRIYSVPKKQFVDPLQLYGLSITAFTELYKTTVDPHARFDNPEAIHSYIVMIPIEWDPEHLTTLTLMAQEKEKKDDVNIPPRPCITYHCYQIYNI